MTGHRLALLAVAALAAAPRLHGLPSQAATVPGAAPSPPCPQAVVGAAVADPEAWTRACACAATGGGACALERLDIDLDLDGAADLLLAVGDDCGNAGCPFFAFAREAGAWRYAGSLFAHPAAVRVLPSVAGGPPRVVAYLRTGPTAGVLRTSVRGPAGFTTTAEETVEPAGKDRARYEALFGTPDGAPTAPPRGDVPAGLAPAHPDEDLETTLSHRFSLEQALASAVTVRACLLSFEELTTEVRTKVPQRRLEEIGNTEPEMQTIGFRNLPGSIEGALRLQEWRLRKLGWELALERSRDGRASDAEVRAARDAFLEADRQFREFWSGFGISD